MINIKNNKKCNINFNCERCDIPENKKNDRIDNKLLKLNLFKVMNNDTAVIYERYDERHNFTQVIAIEHKASGNHIIQSYEKGCNKDGFNNVVGLTFEEIKLLNKKIKRLHWK